VATTTQVVATNSATGNKTREFIGF
jgi:hypothetical protein